MTMAKPKTELAQQCPPPPYTHWDQRGRPVLLSGLKLMNGKELRLSLQTQDPDIARGHIRLLVAMLVDKGSLSPNGGAAKIYGPKGTGRSRLAKVDRGVRRLKGVSDAKYGSEALAAAKRRGCPVGIFHHLAGRKPGLSVAAYRTRRMRARERGEQIAKGTSWHYRRVGGKCFYLNGGVMNARLEVAGTKYTWPLPTRDRDEAAAIMDPVRVARERIREAAKRLLDYQLGSVEYMDAVRSREKECIALAAAIIDAGGPIELAKAVQDLRPGEDGTALPMAVKAKPMKQAARKNCLQRYIELMRAHPDGAPEPRTVLEKEMMDNFHVTLHEARDCRREAIRRTGNLNWRRHGRPRADRLP
jgi:hypothetical protein